MSLHRRAAKRDAAEPTIVSALEAMGCVVWRVSGKGLPDLVVFYRRKSPVMGGPNQKIFVADVKGPKEKATAAQEEKWTALINLGFSVFILRTPEDAQKMLNNALQPWEPTPSIVMRQPRLKGSGDTLTTRRVQELKAGYTPPRSARMDAAKEAESTFAPVALCEKCKKEPAMPDDTWCAGCLF